MDIRSLTILHSNDMHGDFFAQQDNECKERFVGGLSMLSSYIRRLRQQREDVLYVICGDILQGSVIDRDYKGYSTVDLINLLEPDVMTLGNHEIDYGLGHLLFLERCAKFPIINANMRIKSSNTRLFNSHLLLEKNGLRILFIGLLTQDVLSQPDPLLQTFVNLDEAAEAVENIVNCHKDIDVDLTVLLTHIGIEEDRKLAAMLPRELGVDLIVGGHSHTVCKKTEEINGIVIAHAGVGTDYIGHLELQVDRDTNALASHRWALVPINDKTCGQDDALTDLLQHYHDITDQKYGQILARCARSLTHPDRGQETELGNLFSDIFQQLLGVDLIFLGSGSIRKEAMAEIVTLKELTEVYPYTDTMYCLHIPGDVLREMVEHMFTKFLFEGGHEFFQVSQGTQIIYDTKAKKLVHFSLRGTEIAGDNIFRVALQKFHYALLQDTFGKAPNQLRMSRSPQLVTTRDSDLLVEYLQHATGLNSRVEGRITFQ